jgi:hypothetical protein
MKKYSTFLLFVLASAICNGQNCCSWASLDSLGNIERSPEFDELSIHESEKLWLQKKNEYNGNYTFLITNGWSPADYYLQSYTLIEVRNDKAFSRKHISKLSHVTDTKWSCQPNFNSCPLKLKMDSIRKTDRAKYNKHASKHLDSHGTPYFETDWFECWEEYNDSVGKHEFSSIPGYTLDDIYQQLKNIESEGAYIDVWTDKDGIITSVRIDDNKGYYMADKLYDKNFIILRLSKVE